MTYLDKAIVGEHLIQLSWQDTPAGTNVYLHPMKPPPAHVSETLFRAAEKWAFDLMAERAPEPCEVNRYGSDVIIQCRPTDRAAFVELLASLSECIQLQAAHEEAAQAVLAGA